MKYLPIAAALVIGATAANAQSLADGFYVQGSVGYSNLQNSDLSGTINPPGGRQTVATSFDDGYNLSFAIGREIPGLSTGSIGTRLELEFKFSDNNVGGVNFTGNGPGAEGNIAGDVRQSAIFANALFDFKSQGRFTPFVGVGAGVAHSDLNIIYGPGVRVRGDDTNFAAQAIAGVSYEVNDNLDIVLDARYGRTFDVSSPRFNPAGGFTGNVSDHLDAFSVNIGVRFPF